jgi:hypothetical protein
MTETEFSGVRFPVLKPGFLHPLNDFRRPSQQLLAETFQLVAAQRIWIQPFFLSVRQNVWLDRPRKFS